MSNEKQNITLSIRDMQIPMSIRREQEPLYREAGQIINNRLNKYFKDYEGLKSDVEIIYYALIDIALHYVAETKRNDIEPIKNILSQLSSEINEALE